METRLTEDQRGKGKPKIVISLRLPSCPKGLIMLDLYGFKWCQDAFLITESGKIKMAFTGTGTDSHVFGKNKVTEDPCRESHQTQ